MKNSDCFGFHTSRFGEIAMNLQSRQTSNQVVYDNHSLPGFAELFVVV
jgi:hypothetical protein